MTPDEALKVVTIDSVAQTTGLSHAQIVNILGLIGDKPEWEYGVGWVYREDFMTGFAMDSLAEAQEHVARYPKDEIDDLEYVVVRRVPERSAGPWEPVA